MRVRDVVVAARCSLAWGRSVRAGSSVAGSVMFAGPHAARIRYGSTRPDPLRFHTGPDPPLRFHTARIRYGFSSAPERVDKCGWLDRLISARGARTIPITCGVRNVWTSARGPWRLGR